MSHATAWLIAPPDNPRLVLRPKLHHEGVICAVVEGLVRAGKGAKPVAVGERDLRGLGVAYDVGIAVIVDVDTVAHVVLVATDVGGEEERCARRVDLRRKGVSVSVVGPVWTTQRAEAVAVGKRGLAGFGEPDDICLPC